MRPLRAPQGTADHRAGQPVRLVGAIRVADVLTVEERALLARMRFVLDADDDVLEREREP